MLHLTVLLFGHAIRSSSPFLFPPLWAAVNNSLVDLLTQLRFDQTPQQTHRWHNTNTNFKPQDQLHAASSKRAAILPVWRSIVPRDIARRGKVRADDPINCSRVAYEEDNRVTRQLPWPASRKGSLANPAAKPEMALALCSRFGLNSVRRYSPFLQEIQLCSRDQVIKGQRRSA